MAQVKWGESFKKSVAMKIYRGATPEEIKASFARMVDGLITPQTKLVLAQAEIRRLRQQLRAKGSKKELKLIDPSKKEGAK
jgi:hypothetical protein